MSIQPNDFGAIDISLIDIESADLDSTKIDPRGQKALDMLKAIFPDKGDFVLNGEVDFINFPKIDGLELTRILGQGSFGIVYAAKHVGMMRTVAVKVARPEVVSNGVLCDRFMRECKLAQSLDHPGIASIYEYGQSNGNLYLVMEFCPGETLRKWLDHNQTTISIDDISRTISQIAAAVGQAHRQGVVHRDLKPANVMIARGDDGAWKTKVVDFGLAIGIEESLLQTQSSVLLGTPMYMSPEQVASDRDQIGPPTDVFAIGSILYECLTGKPPFVGETIAKVLDNIRRCEPEPVRSIRPNAPIKIEIICHACLQLEPQSRYPNGSELSDDLERFSKGESILARATSSIQLAKRWLSKSNRITEFGLGLIAINMLVLAWAVLNYPIAILLNPESPHEINAARNLFLPMVAMIVPIHGFLLWSSHKIYQQKQTRKFVLFHLAFTLAIAVMALITICLAPREGAQGIDRFERIAGLGLISSFAEMQSILLILLLVFCKFRK